MGREATVSWGGPELIFTNDWKAGLLIKVSAWSTGINVRFYSSKLGRKVETVTEEPYAYREPTTHLVKNPALKPGERSVVQEAGPAGFTVEYTRKVYRGDKLIKDEHYRTRYDPGERVRRDRAQEEAEAQAEAGRHARDACERAAGRCRHDRRQSHCRRRDDDHSRRVAVRHPRAQRRLTVKPAAAAWAMSVRMRTPGQLMSACGRIAGRYARQRGCHLWR